MNSSEARDSQGCQHDRMKPNPTLRPAYPTIVDGNVASFRWYCNKCQCPVDEPISTTQVAELRKDPNTAACIDAARTPPEPLPALASRVSELEMERDALAKDNHDLRTVMIAAAEEISEHWLAHCDAEGYGPSNLLRRLEIGIPSEYGYTAGAFRKLKEELAAAELAAAANLHAAQRTNLTFSVHIHCTACGGSGRLGGLPCHCRQPPTKSETR